MRSDTRHNRAELFTGANCDSPLITSDPYYPHLLVWSQFREDSRAGHDSGSCLPLLWSHKLLKTPPAPKNPLLFSTTANNLNFYRFCLYQYNNRNIILTSTKEIVFFYYIYQSKSGGGKISNQTLWFCQFQNFWQSIISKQSKIYCSNKMLLFWLLVNFGQVECGSGRGKDIFNICIYHPQVKCHNTRKKQRSRSECEGGHHLGRGEDSLDQP